MNPRQIPLDIELGAFGRVIYRSARRGGLLRANDTALWPATRITVVLIF